MYLDENDSEGWSYGTNKPVLTFEEALHSITGDFWVYLHPLEIHPEYRKIVWFELQKIVSSLPDDSLEHWNHAKDRWQEMCGEGT